MNPDDVLTVSDLTFRIKARLEGMFPSVWVTGEVSNLTRASSGHIYFSLKDDEAQLKAVIWRTAARELRFDLQNGMEVLCCGNLDLYPPRGTYQLVTRRVEPLGEGALQLAFRQLQQRLSKEGLFDPALKRPLPRFPRCIAVVTSPSGAAIRDFLEVLRRRWRKTEVLIIPARVQGEGSAAEIARGIQAANRLNPRPDILVVTRGGGSLEDLWSFNEEIVVRAIHESALPVVSAVGHEVDVTLSDLVADLRAATPTEAAELVTPDEAEVRAVLVGAGQRINQILRRRLQMSRERLMTLAKRRELQRPEFLFEVPKQRLHEMSHRLTRVIQQRLESEQQTVAQFAARLDGLSPLEVLARGYSVTKTTDGNVVRSIDEVASGEKLTTIVGDGEIHSRVESVENRTLQ